MTRTLSSPAATSTLSAWRIYYSDGATFDAAQGEPWQAPNYHVVAILQGPVEHGMDWYLWRRDWRRWVGVKGDASLVLQFQHNARYIDACVAGENLPNEVFQPVLDQAIHDQSSHRPI